MLGLVITEIYLAGKGRCIYELILECIDGPALPRFTIGLKFPENTYLALGSYRALPVLVMPYLFSPPVTGLEYAYMTSKIKEQNGIWDEFVESIRNFFVSKE